MRKILVEKYRGNIEVVNEVIDSITMEIEKEFKAENLPIANALRCFEEQGVYPYIRMLGPFDDGSFRVDYGNYTVFLRISEVK